jgi:hypothetical protein
MARAKKRKKLENKAKIRRRLLRMWSEKVRLAHGNKCAFCGMPNETIIAGTKQKLDAHHIESKLNPSLRFDIMNGIALDVWHHKFGKDSFHRSAISTMDWLLKNRPKQHEYILAHRNDVLDLDDRETLARIEQRLTEPLTAEQIDLLSSKPVWDGKHPQGDADESDSDSSSSSADDLFSP